MSMGGGVNLGTATFYITGNASGASNAAVQANNALAQLSQTVANNWWGVQNLGLAFSALPAAVAAGVGASVKAAIEWQDAMFAVERTTGATGDALDAIEQDILDVARSVPIATTQIANLAAAGAQLGVAEGDVAKFAATYGTLMSATNLTEANLGDFARVLNVLNVPTDQWENFANNLLEVGRNTAATESEILNFSRRLAATGAQAKMTSSDVLGISAAVISLGPRAEAGATAVQKTIFDMTRAISAGGADLEKFAAVAHMSGDEFARAFADDSAKAFAAFITGLDQLKGGGPAAIAILDELGITESRQANALLALAAGTRNVGSEQTDLNTILQKSNQYGQTNATLIAIQEAKAKTLSGQIQILRNALFEMGQVIGGFLVGPMGFFIQRLLDFLVGVQHLPAPIKVLIGVLGLFVTGMFALASVLFLVGPRVLIAMDALNRMRGGVTTLTPEIYKLGQSYLGTASAAGLMGKAVESSSRQAIIAANNAAIAANVTGNEYAAMQTRLAGLAGVIATESSAATVSMGRMAAMGTTLAAAMGWVTLALAAVAAVTTYLGNKQRQAAEDAKKELNANEDLTSIMRQQGATVGATSLQWVRAQARYKTAAVEAAKLGLSLQTVEAVITGQATPKQMDELVTLLRSGGAEAEAMGHDIYVLGQIFKNSAGQAGVAEGSISDVAGAEDGLTDSTAQATEELKKQATAMEKVAQAHIDLASAVSAQRDAQIAVKDAQEAYKKALLDVEDPTLALRRAELDLAAARFAQAEASRDVLEKEKDLSEAREKGALRARNAELDLADAKDRYLDTLTKVEDLEAKLAELRLGPSADALRDATNDLRNAELKLARAHQTVEDAEWNLQHLREEGASNRDIEDAELALAEARQNVADSQDDVIDSTKKLNDLQDDGQRAKAIADAERDLAGAYRDAERALQDITEKQNALQEARDRVANDTDYIDAQAALVDAQSKVQDAIRKTADAELELEAIREGRAERDAQRAALELEQTLIRMAQANADVRKETALANGETWDAGDAAHALGEELSKLVDMAPDAQSRQRLQKYIDTLMSAPNVPDAPETDVAFDPESVGLPSLSDVQDYRDQLGEILGEDKGPKTDLVHMIFGDDFGGDFKRTMDRIGGWIHGGFETIGRNLPNWFGNTQKWFSELPATIGGWFVDAGGWLVDAGASILNGLWDGITSAASALFHGIGDWFYDLLVRPFKDALDIHSPSGVFDGLGHDIIDGLWNGLTTAVTRIFGFFIGLPGQILGALGDLGSWLWGKGSDLISGLGRGIDSAWNGIWNFFVNLPSTIFNAVGDIGSTLMDVGRNIVQGLWNGIVERWNQVIKGATGLFGKFITVALDTFGVASPSKVFHKIGSYIMEGLDNGLQSQQRALEQTIADTAGMMEDGLARDYLSGWMLDPSTGSGSFVSSAAGMSQPGGGNVYNYEVFDLDAITTADPNEIVNEYVWAKRVRVRGK